MFKCIFGTGHLILEILQKQLKKLLKRKRTSFFLLVHDQQINTTDSNMVCLIVVVCRMVKSYIPLFHWKEKLTFKVYHYHTSTQTAEIIQKRL